MMVAAAIRLSVTDSTPQLSMLNNRTIQTKEQHEQQNNMDVVKKALNTNLTLMNNMNNRTTWTTEQQNNMNNMNNRATTTTEQHGQQSNNNDTMAKKWQSDSFNDKNFFGRLNWSALLRRQKISMADTMSPRSFDEQTPYSCGFNAIRDHPQLKSDFRFPSATNGSSSTVALTIYGHRLKLRWSWHLQLTNFPSDYCLLSILCHDHNRRNPLLRWIIRKKF